ncbi:MAG: dTMP kinase [Candidatus Undinarchaeales archaeon]
MTGNEKGILVALEGVDGCGKSTHAEKLAKWLKGKERDVLHTKEPSKGPIGVLLRQYLKMDAPPRVDALLFTADRSEHIQNEINPALNEGKIVLCERYIYSTIAYQAAQGLDWDWLVDLNSFAPEPDLTILLSLRPDIAVKRTTTEEKFEELEVLKKVNKNYKKLAEEHNFKMVDASKGKTVVQKEIRRAVSEYLDLND